MTYNVFGGSLTLTQHQIDFKSCTSYSFLHTCDLFPHLLGRPESVLHIIGQRNHLWCCTCLYMVLLIVPHGCPVSRSRVHSQSFRRVSFACWLRPVGTSMRVPVNQFVTITECYSVHQNGDNLCKNLAGCIGVARIFHARCTHLLPKILMTVFHPLICVTRVTLSMSKVCQACLLPSTPINC